MHNAKYKALSLTMAIITAATPIFSTYPVYAESVNDMQLLINAKQKTSKKLGI